MSEMSDGLSERIMVFKPGFEIDGEPVCRTFQPSYAVSRTGRVLAFCQARLKKGRDDDPKIPVVTHSDDLGKTWADPRPVSAPMNHFAISAYAAEVEGGERISFICVVDMRVTENYYGKDYGKMKRRTGIDVDLVGRETPMVLCRFDSIDGGASWAMTLLTGDDSPLNKRYGGAMLVFLNPIGQVHVIPEGPLKGRMVIGCHLTAVPEGEPVSNHFRNHPTSGSGAIYSDDQGLTWTMDGMIMDYLGNECSVVSINHGSDLLMIRRVNGKKKMDERAPTTDFRPGEKRLAHTSSDCGATWSDPFVLPISEVICHGTLARIGDRLIFSIPAGPVERSGDRSDQNQRVRGTLYFSDDEGKTWESKLLEPDTFSYSAVGRLNGYLNVCMYAVGAMGQDGIGCRLFTDEWLSKA